MRFFIIDPSLYDAGGHNLDYAREVVASVVGQGIEAVVLSNSRFIARPDFTVDIIPVFTQGLRDPTSLATRLKASAFHRLRRLGQAAGLSLPTFEPLGDRAATLVRDLSRWAAKADVSADDLWFFPTVTWRDAIAVIAFHRTLASPPDLHIVLRFDPPDDKLAREQLKHAVGAATRLTLWADTPELAAAYADVCMRPLNQIRMPFPPHVVGPRPERPYLLYLGEARADKGFQFLPNIVEQVRAHLPDADLVVQMLADPNGSRETRMASQALADAQGPQLTLLHGPLSSEKFCGLISAAGAVLCLHDPQIYRYRSAGMVTQAVSAGVPVIMRRGISAPYTMITRNGCEDLVYFIEGDGARDCESLRLALRHTSRTARVLDCTDRWDAPWLNITIEAA